MGKRYKIYYPTVGLVKYIVRFLREAYPEDHIVFTRSVDDILSAAKWCRLRAKSTRDRILWYAACLFYYFVTGHPLSDGNKRCATMLTLWFLRKNGYYVYRRSSMYSLALNTAMGRKSKEDVYKWLRKNVRRLE